MTTNRLSATNVEFLIKIRDSRRNFVKRLRTYFGFGDNKPSTTGFSKDRNVAY